ncbi:hypothetical protein CesoFtcFv8_025663 [Champsocephalus esox]|uniref:Uncharacterized protein n=1 Tax=Champsocephalus esox TaxID=159716 RepID=A0AAN8B0S9_9TELE|nr:hypothetical protein CesoFtcFv8_025663 [Champsocephalus esox]
MLRFTTATAAPWNVWRTGYSCSEGERPSNCCSLERMEDGLLVFRGTEAQQLLLLGTYGGRVTRVQRDRGPAAAAPWNVWRTGYSCSEGERPSSCCSLERMEDGLLVFRGREAQQLLLLGTYGGRVTRVQRERGPAAAAPWNVWRTGYSCSEGERPSSCCSMERMEDGLLVFRGREAQQLLLHGTYGGRVTRVQRERGPAAAAPWNVWRTGYSCSEGERPSSCCSLERMEDGLLVFRGREAQQLLLLGTYGGRVTRVQRERGPAAAAPWNVWRTGYSCSEGERPSSCCSLERMEDGLLVFRGREAQQLLLLGTYGGRVTRVQRERGPAAAAPWNVWRTGYSCSEGERPSSCCSLERMEDGLLVFRGREAQQLLLLGTYGGRVTRVQRERGPAAAAPWNVWRTGYSCSEGERPSSCCSLERMEDGLLVFRGREAQQLLLLGTYGGRVTRVQRERGPAAAAPWNVWRTGYSCSEGERPSSCCSLERMEDGLLVFRGREAQQLLLLGTYGGRVTRVQRERGPAAAAPWNVWRTGYSCSEGERPSSCCSLERMEDGLLVFRGREAQQLLLLGTYGGRVTRVQRERGPAAAAPWNVWRTGYSCSEGERPSSCCSMERMEDGLLVFRGREAQQLLLLGTYGGRVTRVQRERGPAAAAPWNVWRTGYSCSEGERPSSCCSLERMEDGLLVFRGREAQQLLLLGTYGGRVTRVQRERGPAAAAPWNVWRTGYSCSEGERPSSCCSLERMEDGLLVFRGREAQQLLLLGTYGGRVTRVQRERGPAAAAPWNVWRTGYSCSEGERPSSCCSMERMEDGLLVFRGREAQQLLLLGTYGGRVTRVQRERGPAAAAPWNVWRTGYSCSEGERPSSCCSLERMEDGLLVFRGTEAQQLLLLGTYGGRVTRVQRERGPAAAAPWNVWRTGYSCSEGERPSSCCSLERMEDGLLVFRGREAQQLLLLGTYGGRVTRVQRERGPAAAAPWNVWRTGYSCSEGERPSSCCSLERMEDGLLVFRGREAQQLLLLGTYGGRVTRVQRERGPAAAAPWNVWRTGYSCSEGERPSSCCSLERMEDGLLVFRGTEAQQLLLLGTYGGRVTRVQRERGPAAAAPWNVWRTGYSCSEGERPSSCCSLERMEDGLLVFRGREAQQLLLLGTYGGRVTRVQRERGPAAAAPWNVWRTGYSCSEGERPSSCCSLERMEDGLLVFRGTEAQQLLLLGTYGGRVTRVQRERGPAAAAPWNVWRTGYSCSEGERPSSCCSLERMEDGLLVFRGREAQQLLLLGTYGGRVTRVQRERGPAAAAPWNVWRTGYSCSEGERPSSCCSLERMEDGLLVFRGTEAQQLLLLGTYGGRVTRVQRDRGPAAAAPWNVWRTGYSCSEGERPSSCCSLERMEDGLLVFRGTEAQQLLLLGTYGGRVTRVQRERGPAAAAPWNVWRTGYSCSEGERPSSCCSLERMEDGLLVFRGREAQQLLLHGTYGGRVTRVQRERGPAAAAPWNVWRTGYSCSEGQRPSSCCSLERMEDGLLVFRGTEAQQLLLLGTYGGRVTRVQRDRGPAAAAPWNVWRTGYSCS